MIESLYEKIQLILALGNLVLAGTIGYLAWRVGQIQNQISLQQVKLSQEELRLALFEKRYLIFERTRDFLDYLNGPRSEASDRVKIDAFRLVVIESMFLFDQEVIRFLEELHDAPYKTEYIESEIRDNVVGEDQWRNSLKERHELRRWLVDARKKIVPLFKPCLHFSTVHL